MEPRTIPWVLRRAAAHYGDLEAVVDNRSRVSFAALPAQVEEIERALLASGVDRGDRVAVWAPNSLVWILVSFAVYGTGAVLVPVNTRYKGEEAAQLLERAGAKLLFTVTDFLGTDYAAALRQSSPEHPVREIVVMSGPPSAGSTPWSEFLARAEGVEPDDVRRREGEVGPNDPSDIIFTSGTTGLPKGAVLRHGASVATYEQWSAGVGLRSGDRMLVVYPFFHTAGLKSGVLASVLVGATIVNHPVFDVPSVMAKVGDERITVLPGPPSVFQSILNDPAFSTFPTETLRLSVTGAAVVPVELVARMRDQLGLDVVMTAYGLTETHGTATICEQSDPLETIATTVGHPLDGLEIRIVDDAGTAQPPGEAGEVLVRGFNLMSGYHDDPEATRQAIDDNGWLHTGDIGVLRDDGYLKIVDRKKDIVIVGGFNVSSAEVESVILRRSDVAQVAVVAAPDGRLGEVPAAFVVAKAGQSPRPEAIVAWCDERLANFKVPRHVYLVDDLPLNPSGKVLKRELRERAKVLAEKVDPREGTG